MEIKLNININNKNFLNFDLLLFSILLVSAILRFYHLGFQSAWLDEVNTFIDSDPKFSLEVMHQKIIAVEGTPHLYFLLVKLMCAIFGHTVWVCRLLSAIVGVASVYYLFLFCSKLFSKKVGYIAALLLTFSFYHIEYSQEARAYSLLVFFIIVAYYRLLIFIEDKSYKNAAIMGFCVGLIPNAHVFGLLNVASIYLTLLFVFISSGKEKRVLFFKQLFVSGIVALIVFYPVVQIIERLSQTQTHWIPAATIDGIKSVFIDILGKSVWQSVLFLVLTLIGLIGIFYKFGNKDSAQRNRLKLGGVLLTIWLFISITIPIVRSYTSDASLILSRYFIGVLPAFIIAAAFALSLIANKIVRYFCVGLLTLMSLYQIFIAKDYYNTLSKSQYDKLTAEIIQKNPQNDKVVSSWGWFLNYYFDNSTSTNIVASNLGDYIHSMEIDAVSTKSFWYFDGNSRPYHLTPDEEKFLHDHFIVDQDLNTYYDSWAKHFLLKTEIDKKEPPAFVGNDEDTKLFLDEFNPHTQNNQGDLLLFDGTPTASKEINFEKGNYKITIVGYSSPEKPIKGENAHIKATIGGKEIGQFYLTENQKGSETVLKFQSDKSQSVKLEIVFDNDLLIDNQDRNAVITNVKIKKM